MAGNQPNEVDEVIRELKKNPGFSAYAILNNDGIVIKYENMDYRTAVHHAHQILALCSKAKKYIRELFEPPDNEVESLRLRTQDHEMIVAQQGHFTLLVIQQSEAPEGGEEGEEVKEGEETKE